MKKSNEIYFESSAFLFVGGYTKISVSDISSMLEMQPTRLGKKRKNQRNDRIRKAWFFSTESTRALKKRSVDDLVNELLSSLEGKKVTF